MSIDASRRNKTQKFTFSWQLHLDHDKFIIRFNNQNDPEEILQSYESIIQKTPCFCVLYNKIIAITSFYIKKYCSGKRKHFWGLTRQFREHSDVLRLMNSFVTFSASFQYLGKKSSTFKKE